MSETVEQLLTRFWSNVDKTGECHIWTGKLCKGYGWFYIGPKSDFAHRISYYFATGELPKSPFCVLHKNICTSKRCVRFEHLYKGTASDNKKDQMDRDGGRRSGGRDFKLDNDDIQTIIILRSEGKSQREIAKLMNVSQWNIWNILNSSKRK